MEDGRAEVGCGRALWVVVRYGKVKLVDAGREGSMRRTCEEDVELGQVIGVCGVRREEVVGW